MTDSEKRIILGYAENDMNLSKTARATHYHPNTIRDYFPRIAKKYGLDPKKFYDLVELVEMAKGE
jgi:sugar diacid utilization regulator